MIIQSPDPFRPGAFFTIRNPESILATHGDAHAECPICSWLRGQIAAAAEFSAPTRRPSVTDTQPLSLERIRAAIDDSDLVAEGPVGFEIVSIPVKDDADASGKIAKLEKAKGVEWIN